MDYSGGLLANNGTGWNLLAGPSPASVAAPPQGWLSGPNTGDIIVTGSQSIARYTAATGWTTLNDPVADMVWGAQGWTDGRFVARVGVNGVVLCDLGP